MCDYIYLKHGTVYILIWESIPSEENVSDQRMTLWYEHNLPFFILGSIALSMLMYLVYNLRLSILADHCESCEQFTDESLYSQNVMVILCESVFIIDFYYLFGFNDISHFRVFNA